MLPAIAAALLESALATRMARPGIQSAMQSYLDLPTDINRDRMVLPILKGYTDFDSAVWGPVDRFGSMLDSRYTPETLKGGFDVAQAPKKTAYKFDKSADTGPVDYKSMDPDMAKTVHEERIRRQIQSRLKMDLKSRMKKKG